MTRGTMPFLEAAFKGTAGTLQIDVALALDVPWTVLFGPSGAGKSTVLHALCGFTRLSTQHITCDGMDLTRSTAPERRFALVPQQPSLFPHLTAFENVLFSLGARHDVSRRKRKAEAERLLRRFQAEAFSGKRPNALSGGEQQRVVLARAVASHPRLLLLDEALSGMQYTLQCQAIEILKDWATTNGTAVLSVTHDIGEAMACADAVLRIQNGRITAQGAPCTILADEREAMLRRLA